MEITQECIKCNVVKPLNEYYEHSEMANGYLGKCKDCCKVDTKNNYRNHIHEYSKYEKKRAKRRKRKVQVSVSLKKWRERHPEKSKAIYLVTSAIKGGRLVKKPCMDCGAENTQAHHFDYLKPLEVIWLCYPCHLKKHGKKKISSPF